MIIIWIINVSVCWNRTINDPYNRGVATNNGLGWPNSNRDLFCVVRANMVLKSLMILRRVNNAEHNIKQKICTDMEVISLIPPKYYI